MATVKSTKPSAKPTTNKLSIAGTRGLSEPLRAALIAMAIVVVGAGAVLGYDAYQMRQYQAHAAGYNYGSKGVCKQAIASIYGPLWQVNMKVSNINTGFYQMTGQMIVYRDGKQIIHNRKLTAYKGETKYGTVWVSRILNDTINIDTNGNTLTTKKVESWNLPTC